MQHAGIQSVSACLNSFIREHTECHGSSCFQLCPSPNSRVVRGPGLRGGTKGQVRQGAGEKLVFSQQLSGRMHVGTWAGGNKSLNLKISQGKEIMARCAVSGSSRRIPFVTPVLPGPGSDIRMKMGWTVLEKTRNSGVWFFRDVEGMLGCGVWPMLIGAVDWVRKGSYHTAWGDSRWFPLHLFVCTRAGPSCRVTYWREVLATASRCVEGYRTPYEALVC